MRLILALTLVLGSSFALAVEPSPKAKPSTSPPPVAPLKPSTGLPQFQPLPGESRGQAELRRTRELRAMRAAARAKARQAAAKPARKGPAREWTQSDLEIFNRQMQNRQAVENRNQLRRILNGR